MDRHTGIVRWIINRKRLIRDFAFNILATCVPIVTLQLLILPGIAAKDGETAYGMIVTLLGVITIGSETVGNSLNNTRLLQQLTYEQRGVEGDFNRILIYGCFADIIIVSVGFVYYRGTLSGLPLTLLAAILILMRMYYIVVYRIQIDYTGMLINSILLSVGYVTGYYIYLRTDIWELIYIIANFISLVYIYFTADLMGESISKTVLFRDTCRRMGGIYVADMLKTFMSYADRLIIFPFLGAVIVANYYVASIVGKMISMAVFPVGSVILSYIVKKNELDKKRLARMGVLFIILSGPFFLLILFVGRIMVGFLYPSMFSDVKDLMYLTSVSALLLAITSLIQPLVLRFRGVRYQLSISIMCLVLYVICSLAGVKANGIVGFCISYCIVLFIKLVLFTIGLARA